MSRLSEKFTVGRHAVLSVFGLGVMAGVFAAFSMYSFNQGGGFYGALFATLVILSIGMLYEGFVKRDIRLYAGNPDGSESSDRETSDGEFIELEPSETSMKDGMKEVIREQIRMSPAVISLVGSFLFGLLLLFGNVTFEFSPEWVAIVVFKGFALVFVLAPILVFVITPSEDDEKSGSDAKDSN